MTEREAPNPIRSFSAALQGLGAGIIMVFLALVNVDYSGHHIGFILLPVAVLYFWPSNASHSWSLLCIFLLGIFHDLASDGPLGMWAFCYLLLFIIMGKGVDYKMSFGPAFSGFGLSLIFVVGICFGLGYILFGAIPNVPNMLTSMLTALVLFPMLYWFRKLFGNVSQDMTTSREM